jgi:hypothetical protein
MNAFSEKIKNFLGSPEILFVEILAFGILLITEYSTTDKNFSIINVEQVFIIFQHVLIGLVSIYILTFSRSGLLTKTCGLFNFVSFSLFPIIETGSNTIYWGGSNLENDSKIFTNFVILSWTVLFAVGNRSSLRIPISFLKPHSKSSLTSYQAAVLITFGYLLLVCLVYMYNWDVGSLFYRGGDGRQDVDTDLKSSYLIVEFFLRPLIFNIGLYIFLIVQRSGVIFFVAIGLMLISAFPTGIPRFLAAALYLPIILNWYLRNPKIQHKITKRVGYFLTNILFFGLVVIMPFLDIFRTFESLETTSFNIINLDTMLAGHFDGYQMTARALLIGDVTFGFGFLGSFLFFVPRSIWDSKPVVSGQEVADRSNLYFDNVSMPLIAEFYLNFWYFGVIFGAVLLGVVARSIDSKFFKALDYNVSIGWIVYFELIGLLLLILRGSFLSAFAYLAAVLLGWVVIHFIKKMASQS